MGTHKIESEALEYLKKQLGLDIIHVQPIPSWQATKHTFLVTTQNGLYALKLYPLGPSSLRNLARSMFGGIGFRNELFMFMTLSGVTLHHFKVPAFVASDGLSFIMTRYILAEDAGSQTGDHRRRLVDALIEWQQLDVRLDPSLRDRIMRSLRRQTPRRIVFRTFLGLKRAHGLGVALRSFRATIACSRRSRREPAGWLEHGDFVQSNEFLGADNDLYIVDFTSASIKHKGRFSDIVMHAVDYGSNGIIIDWLLIEYFIEALWSSPIVDTSDSFTQNRLINDLRLAMLLRVIHYIAKYDAHSKHSEQWSNGRVLLDKLLDREQFHIHVSNNYFPVHIAQ